MRVTGLDDSSSLGSVPSTWPEWHVTVGLGAQRDEKRPETVGADEAFLRFGDGSSAAVFRRSPGGRVRLTLSQEVPSSDLAHPFLAPVGMVSAYWGGRLPLHAASFGIGGKAWLIAAEKGGGKSTTLAMLELEGHPILTDDLSIIESDLTVHRGPRFIDLRNDAAQALGVGDRVGQLGVRERWRYRIGDGPLTLPLGGIVIPEWGEPRIEPIFGSSRLPALGPSLALRVPAWWNELFMDIALSVPVFQWRRRRELQEARRGIDQLLDVVAASSEG